MYVCYHLTAIELALSRGDVDVKRMLSTKKRSKSSSKKKSENLSASVRGTSPAVVEKVSREWILNESTSSQLRRVRQNERKYYYSSSVTPLWRTRFRLRKNHRKNSNPFLFESWFVRDYLCEIATHMLCTIKYHAHSIGWRQNTLQTVLPIRRTGILAFVRSPLQVFFLSSLKSTYFVLTSWRWTNHNLNRGVRTRSLNNITHD